MKRLSLFSSLLCSFAFFFISNFITAMPLHAAVVVDTDGSYSVYYRASGTDATSYRERRQGQSWGSQTPPYTSSWQRSNLTSGIYEYLTYSCTEVWNPILGEAFPMDCSRTGAAYSKTYYVIRTPGSVSAPSSSKTGSFTVSWSSVSNISKYRLQQRKNNGSWVTIYTGSARTKTVSGLGNGSYRFRVRSELGSYSGSFKTSSATTVLLPPPVPSSISVPSSTVKNGVIAISWSASATANNYTLQESVNNGSWSTVTTRTATSYSVSGRGNGNYRYRVRANNASGNKGWKQSSGVTVLHPPAMPSSISVPTSTVTNGTITISWSASATANNYTLQESKNNGSWQTLTTRNATSYSVSGRSNGTYKYRVRAQNSSGYRNEWRSSSSVTVLHPPVMPGSISVPSATVKNGVITVSWSASATANNYTLQESKNNGSWQTLTTRNATSYSVSGRSNGSYKYRVRAQNSSGYFNQWRTSSSVTVLYPAPMPSSITVPNSTIINGNISISWSAASTATSYVLQEQKNNGAWQTIRTQSNRNYTASGKSNGQYRYQVQACNSSGCSGWRRSSTTTVLLPPATPASLTVPSSTVRDGNVALQWPSVSGAVNYQLQRKSASGTWSTVAESASSPHTDILVPDGVFQYQVKACNASGCSGWRASSTVTLVQDIPMWRNLTEVTVPDAAPSSVNLASVNLTAANLNGKTGVSGGQASYQLPIELPPGRAGIQPNVAISYNSQSGNGILGVGFNLSAGSSISRCGSTQVHDGLTRSVTFNANTDRLCFNGQRLVAEQGGYGQNNTQYRTEIDSFIRVIQHNAINASNSYFTVQYPDGHTATYGDKNDSSYIPHGLSTPLSWKIAQQRYSDGDNTVNYFYNEPVSGEHLLEAIKYTGNGSSDGNRKVEFIYQARPDKRFGFIRGGETATTRRLQYIRTYAVDSTWVSQYEFNYAPSEASGRSLLESITRCGRYNGSKQCMPETTFNWLDASPMVIDETLKIGQQEVYDGSVKVEEFTPVADGNGDGVLDFPNYYTDAEQRNTGSHDYGFRDVCHYNAFSGKKTCSVADIDGDGKTDIIRPIDDKLAMRLSTNASAGFVKTNITYYKDLLQKPDVIEALADFNGDTYPDLLMRRSRGTKTRWELFVHTGSSTQPYQGSTVIHEARFYLDQFEKLDVNIIPAGDLDGNGLPDLAYTTNRSKFGAVPVRGMSGFFLNQSTNYQIKFAYKDAPDFGFTQNPGRVVSDFFFFNYLTDVNGDGLVDILAWQKPNSSTIQLGYLLNTGTADFTDWQAFSGNVSLKQRGFVLKGFAEEPFDVIYPKYFSSIHSQDIDGDGINEMLLPGARLITGCASIKVPLGNKWYSKTFCGDELYQDVAASPDANFPTIPIDSQSFDESIYRYDAIKFVANDDGSYGLIREATNYKGSAYEASFTDAFGDGLVDMISAYGPRIVEGQHNETWIKNPASSIWGSNYGAYISRNYGSGSGEHYHSYQPTDYLQSVTDGFGNRSEWNYRPLSTGDSSAEQCRGDECQMYFPTPDYINDNEDYLHFASSMYVVQAFEQTNGVGGANNTEFAYQGAMYHKKGRGFTGFRHITGKDVQRSIYTHSLFEQTFPKVGQLLNQQTVFDGVNLRTLTNTWLANPNHNVPNVVHQYLQRSELVSKELDGSLMTRVVTEVPDSADIDEYGHILKKEVTTTDYIDGSQETSYRMTTEAVYDPNESDWWLHKMTQQSTATEVIDRSWSDDPLRNGSALDVKQILTVNYSDWNTTHRKPETVTTSASDATCQRIEKIIFNNYGLPSSSSVEGTAGTSGECGVANVRNTSYGYTNDGYFPETVTNAKGHVTSTEYHSGFGTPTKVTSASGVETTTTLDAIGRPISITSTGQPTQYLRYLKSTSGNHSPTHAKTLVITKAMGSPTTEVYSDSLGRELRTVTQGFASEYRYTDKVYDFKGRLIKESLPYLNGQSPVYTEYGGFDELDRPTSRTLPHGLTSSYTYLGLKTEITVNGNRNMSRTYNSRKWLLETVDAIDGTNRFSYDAAGRPLVIEDAKGEQIQAHYNGFGHKTSVADPNQGTTEFKYNTLGELTWQQDANGVELENTLDTLGRVTHRQIVGGNNAHTAIFNWDDQKQGMLDNETANGVTRSYQYDAASRLTQTTIAQSSKTFTVSTQYDANYGRVKGLTYPNGLTLAYEYNDNGYLTHTKNAATDFIYREVTEMDWAGRITQAQLAEDMLEQTTLYDTDSSVMLSTQVTKNGSVIHAHDYKIFDAYKNLVEEQNRVTGLTKVYGYDDLNRLTSYNFSNSNTPSFDHTVYYQYDATGNLLKKSDYSKNYDSAYRYGGDAACSASQKAGSNAVCRIEKLDNTIATFHYDNKGNLLTGDGLSVSYNFMDKPLSASRSHSKMTGGNSSFVYGSDGMRAKQIRTVNGNNTTTYYVDKLYEQDSDGSWRAYIEDVAVLSYTPQRKHQILYTLRDRLGSATTLVDHNGMTVSQRYFDPFGRAVDMGYNHYLASSSNEPYTAGLVDLNETNRYRRGFTDHEHLNEIQVLHMGGRIYSFNIGRFLSVDPFIQSPTSTQSPNPYSYIMNNPLAGTDPTGYTADEPELEKIEYTKTEKKVKVTGSHLKKTVTSSVSGTATYSNGGGTQSFSATYSDTGKLTSSKIGSLQQVSHSQSTTVQNPSYGNDPNFQQGVQHGYGQNSITNNDLISLGVGVSPAGIGGDFYTALTGKDFFTDEEITGFWRWAGIFPLASEIRKASTLAEFTKRTDFQFLNKAGKFYPQIPDLRTGKPIAFPVGDMKKIPKANRVSWGAKERGEFIKEWYNRGYSTPRGGWSEYDIHHIQPREFGGSNNFWNLTPIQRATHQKEFNTFWRDM